jgi:hypothetical protein
MHSPLASRFSETIGLVTLLLNDLCAHISTVSTSNTVLHGRVICYYHNQPGASRADIALCRCYGVPDLLHVASLGLTASVV